MGEEDDYVDPDPPPTWAVEWLVPALYLLAVFGGPAGEWVALEIWLGGPE
jgi:hypothetical protein